MLSTKVLVVEDEGIIAKDLKHSLLNCGYTVIGTESNGEDAIQRAAENPPDVVLMDICLDGPMDGITAAQAITRQRDIPIIYLTAYADEGTLGRAKLTHPFGYLLKPFTQRELYATIEMALSLHQAQTERTNQTRWFTTTLKNIPDGILTTDQVGTVTFMNPAAESLTGWTGDQAVGKPLTMVFHPGDTGAEDHIQEVLKQVLATKEIHHMDTPTAFGTLGERTRLFVYSAAPIVSDIGHCLGAVFICRDMTSRVQALENHEKANKLESLGLLAGGIAHDFNNLLTAILGNLSLAKMVVNQEEHLYQWLSEAERASLRAHQVTGQLVTFATGGQPVKKPVNLSALIRESTYFLLHGSKVQWTLHLPNDLWPVSGDEAQLSQVLQNLILNASQSMPHGGTLTVQGENLLCERPMPESDESPASPSFVKITIIDQGEGIAKEDLSKIFDPYFTTKQDGRGLGLATTYGILRNHGGNISVNSETGHGTRVEMVLPASSEPLSHKQAEEGDPIPGKGRLLIMDDNEGVRMVLEAMLIHLGYEVEVTKDGQQTLAQFQKAKEAGRPFQAVILDLTVPFGMGGRETMKHLLALDSQTKAIVSSGYSEDAILSRFQEFGFVGRISKPYKLFDLSREVHRVIHDERP